MAEQQHTFNVSIVTPSGEVYVEPAATLVVLTTLNGELGVMANHNPLITALKISEVKLKTADQTDPAIVAINGGFAEFSNNELTIVVDAAEASGDIDVLRAEQARERAERHLQEARNKREEQRAQAALLRAVNRIHAATGQR